MYKYVCLHVGMCMWIKGHTEARHIRTPGAGITGSNEHPHVGNVNQTWLMLLTPESSLQALTTCFKYFY